MYMIATSPAIGAVPPAAPVTGINPLTAPFAVPCMGPNSVPNTPAFDATVVGIRVRDGKQAAPPRGELR
jgi:hypothetical protein